MITIFVIHLHDFHDDKCFREEPICFNSRLEELCQKAYFGSKEQSAMSKGPLD